MLSLYGRNDIEFFLSCERLKNASAGTLNYTMAIQLCLLYGKRLKQEKRQHKIKEIKEYFQLGGAYCFE